MTIRTTKRPATTRSTPGQGSLFPTIPTATWRPNDDGSRSMVLGRYHLTARPEGRGRDKTWILEVRRDATTGPYLDRQRWLANLNDARDAALEMIRRDTDPYHAARGTGAPAISADDPGAIAKLQARIAELRSNLDMMVRDAAIVDILRTKTNAAVKRYQLAQLGIVDEILISRMLHEDARKLKKPNMADREVVKRKIEDAEERVSKLERRDTVKTASADLPPTDDYPGGATVYEDTAANRIVIRFNDRISTALAKELKGRGWHWSPKRKEWLRQRTGNAARSAGYLLGFDARGVFPIALEAWEQGDAPLASTDTRPRLTWVAFVKEAMTRGMGRVATDAGPMHLDSGWADSVGVKNHDRFVWISDSSAEIFDPDGDSKGIVNLLPDQTSSLNYREPPGMSIHAILRDAKARGFNQIVTPTGNLPFSDFNPGPAVNARWGWLTYDTIFAYDPTRGDEPIPGHVWLLTQALNPNLISQLRFDDRVYSLISGKYGREWFETTYPMNPNRITSDDQIAKLNAGENPNALPAPSFTPDLWDAEEREAQTLLDQARLERKRAIAWKVRDNKGGSWAFQPMDPITWRGKTWTLLSLDAEAGRWLMGLLSADRPWIRARFVPLDEAEPAEKTAMRRNEAKRRAAPPAIDLEPEPPAPVPVAIPYARPQVTQPRAPKGRAARRAKAAPATTPIAIWRRATTAYLTELRRKRPDASKRTAALKTFWAVTLDLAGRFGLDVAGWIMDPTLAAEADQWWVKQSWTLSGPVGIVDTLAAAVRSVATRLEAGLRKGGIDQAAAFSWLALVVKLIQASERIPGLSLAPTATIPAPASAKPSRAKREKRERDACSPPRPRRGDAARCSGDWDNVLNCVIRSGGIRPGTAEAGELKHAAGEGWKVAAKLIRKNAPPFSTIAATLAEEGFVPWDEFGRVDESAALERIVDVLRGGYDRALPELNACQLARVERRTIEEYEREIADRALAELEAAGELPPGTYQIEMEGDEIPF